MTLQGIRSDWTMKMTRRTEILLLECALQLMEEIESSNLMLRARVSEHIMELKEEEERQQIKPLKDWTAIPTPPELW